MSFSDRVEVKSNLKLTVRERGKIVTRREGHNIWLDVGRGWMLNLFSYATLPGLTTYEDNRIRYIGLGIGGTRQLLTGVANAPPLLGDYPGTNLQTDTDPTVTELERPVQASSGIWLLEVGSPPDFGVNQVTYSRIIGQSDVTYGSYNMVPLSEVMLFTNAADPTQSVNGGYGIAYDTYDSIPKTGAIDIELAWTLRS